MRIWRFELEPGDACRPHQHVYPYSWGLTSLDRASPNFMGLASLGLEIGIFVIFYIAFCY